MMDDLRQPLICEQQGPNTQWLPHTIWQWINFNWITPTLSKGISQHQLHFHDLPPLPPSVLPSPCSALFWQAWDVEIPSAIAQCRDPSLLRALFKPFGIPFLWLGLLKFTNDMLNFAAPVALNGLLSYLSSPKALPPSSLWTVDSITSSSKIPFDFTFLSGSNPLSNAGLFLFHHGMDPKSDYFGAACGCLLVGSLLLKAYLNAHYTYQQGLISSRLRSAIQSAVFSHTMDLKTAALSKVGSGRIQTLMSVDVDKILGFVTGFHELWSLPMQIIIALILLYTQVRFAFLAGLVVVLAVIPLTKVLSNRIQVASQAMMHAKDKRVQLVNEVIQGIKAIKAYVWEDIMKRKIEDARSEELKALAVKKYLDALCVYLWAVTSMLCCVGTVIMMVLLGDALEAKTVFTAIALFGILLGPINSLPFVINGVMEATVSLERLKQYLSLQQYNIRRSTIDGIMPSAPVTSNRKHATSTNEYPPLYACSNDHSGDESAADVRTAAAPTPFLTHPLLEMNHCSFSWSHHSHYQRHNLTSPSQSQDHHTSFTLKDINLVVERGTFVVVTGDVGSGKSSLLSAMLGEMHLIDGTCTFARIDNNNDGDFIDLESCVPSSSSAVAMSRDLHSSSKRRVKRLPIPYVPQSPWVMPGTIRDNILMGKDLHRTWYDNVIHACALDEDFSRMPLGDLTLVADVGSTLSGGQRARVALARALYHGKDSKIFLFDDVLANVDAKVEQWLTTHIFQGTKFLKNKAVVIVTRSQALIQQADVVVTMRGGTVAFIEENKKSSINNSTIPASTNNSSTSAITEGATLNHVLQTSQSSFTALASHHSQPSEGKQEEEEHREVGHVKWTIYKKYIAAQGVWWSLTLISMALMQATRNGSDMWISFWVSQQNITSTIDDGTQGDQQFHNTMAHASSSSTSTTTTMTLGRSKGTNTAHDALLYYKILLLLTFLNSIFTLVRAFSFAQGGLVAARRLQDALLASVLSLAPSFFDATPHGRILNRFSSDVSVVDDSLPFISNIFLANLFGLTGVIVILCFTQPYIAAMVLPLIPAYKVMQRYYRASSRELRRLDSAAKSPVYSSFLCLLSGGATIRAFDVGEVFLRAAHAAMATQQRASLAALVASMWLGLRLQMMAACIAAGITGLAIAQHAGCIPGIFSRSSAPGLVGLSLVYILPITNMLNGLVVTGAETEQDMVAVERIQQYAELEPQRDVLMPTMDASLHSFSTISKGRALESPSTLTSRLIPSSSSSSAAAAAAIATERSTNFSSGIGVVLQDSDDNEKRFMEMEAGKVHRIEKATLTSPFVLSSWPHHGHITFCNVWLRYTPTSGFVLQRLSLNIPSGTKAAICGRTGAGKSSAMACMMRLTEIFAGDISIDGLDVRTIPLKVLRGCIGYVPQSPLIISGSIEENVDPRKKERKERVVEVLKKVLLWDELIASYLGHRKTPPSPPSSRSSTSPSAVSDAVLSLRLGDGGVTLSSGQQQMLCLARIILQQPRIICLDESTASIDSETAMKMHRILYEEFCNATIVEIAHRLDNVVYGCDVVYILEAGKVIEEGNPDELMNRKGSVFRGMVIEQQRGQLKKA